MCIKCHSQLQESEILGQLSHISEKDFINFNQTSINHLVIMALGYNTDKIKKLSIDILRQYIKWNESNYKINFDNLDKIGDLL